MPFFCSSGEEIRPGDRVLIHGEAGEIEFIADPAKNSDDWYVKQHGGGSWCSNSKSSAEFSLAHLRPQRAVDRAKPDTEAAHWQVIRKAHDRLKRAIAEQPLSNACHWLDFHLWCAEDQRQYKESMVRLQRMENVTGLTEQLYARIMAEHGPSRGETIH